MGKREQFRRGAFAFLGGLLLLAPVGVFAGWVTEQPEGTGPYGYWTSLALDGAGSPIIAYRDSSGGGNLRVLRRSTGSWVRDIIESGFDINGGQTSLALNNAGDPRLSYYKTGAGLRFAAWEGSTWTVRTVDPSGGQFTSLKIMPSGDAFISYSSFSSSNTLKCAKWDGVAWSTSTVDIGGVGFWNSLALDSAGRPFISYYDSVNKDLKMAQWTGVRWSTQTVVSTGDVGKYSSIAIAPSGRPSISYIDGSSLKLAQWNGSVWEIQTVDPGVSAYTSLVLDGAGSPSISYESALSSLKVATRTGAVWSTEMVDPNYGRYSSLALGNDGSVHVAYGSTFLGYAKKEVLVAPTDVAVSTKTATGLTWTWIDNSSGETGYRVLRASDRSPLSGDLPVNTGQWIQTGLTPNTSSQIVVQAFNVYGTRDSAVSPIRFTSAASPVNLVISSSTLSSADLAWSANGNPESTRFRLERSSDTVYFNLVSSGSETHSTATGLLDDATHYFRVRAQNAEGELSAFAPMVSLYLPPSTPTFPPVSLSVKSRTTTSITWAWVDKSHWETGVQVLRSSDLVPLSDLLSANTTEWTQTGLAPNTSSQITVRVMNGFGTSDSAPSPVRYSLAAAPSGTQVDSLLGTTAALSWSANGNPESTMFRLEKSVDGISYGLVSTGTAPNASVTGLIGGTTTFFRVRAENGDGIATAFAPPTSVFVPSATPPPPPGTPTVKGRTQTEITWTWLDNSVTESGFQVFRATPLVSLSGLLPANLGEWTQTGLTPNTSAQIIVRATNTYGSNDSLASPIAYSLAAPPVGTALLSSAGTSATLSWSANGNPEGTRFRLEKSVDGVLFSLVSIGTVTQAVAGGLVDGATNYFRVRAENGDGISTGYDLTLPFYLPPALPPTGASDISVIHPTTATLTWTWKDNAFSETGYEILRATDLAPLSENLPANTTEWTQSGLTPNSSSQIIVRGFNGFGHRDSVISPVRWTLAAPPRETTVVSATGTTVQLSWSANGNPVGTPYGVEKSAEGFSFSLVSVTTSPFATITDLIDGTTTYFRVRGENANAVPTAYDNVVAVFLPPKTPPTAPDQLLVETRTATSLTWVWKDYSYNEIGFRVLRNSDLTVLATLPANTTSWTQSGLGPNTRSTVQVEAFHSLGVGRTSRLYNDREEFTLAAPPNSLAISQVTPTSVTLTWSMNGNPPGTIYRGYLSTDNVNFSFFGETPSVPSLIAKDLVSGKVYYFKVEAVNGGFVATPAVAGISALVPFGPPSNPVLQTDILRKPTSLDWKWERVGNATGYRIRRLSDGAALSGDLPATTLRWAHTGLDPDSAYSILIEAFNDLGSSSTVATAVTLPLPPSDTRIAHTSASSITLAWTSNGNPLETLYTAEISTDNVHFSPFSTAHPGLSATATALESNTTYSLRVKTVGKNSDETAFDRAVSALFLDGPPLAPVALTPTKTSDAVTWRWADSPNEQGYRVLRSGVNISGDLPADTTSWSQTAFVPGESLDVRVEAFNGFGTASDASHVVALPLAPKSSHIVTVTPSSIEISWDRNGNSAATTYVVESATDMAHFVKTKSGLARTSTVLEGLESGTTFFLRVGAWNGQSEDAVYYDTVLSTAVPYGPPAVTNPSVLNRTSTHLVWAWENRTNAQGYRILNEFGTHTLAHLPAGTTTWIQTGLTPFSHSGIQVEAFNDYGVSRSNRTYSGLEATTLSNPPTKLTVTAVRPTEVRLSWSNNGNPATIPYRIERASWSFPAVPDHVLETAQGQTSTTIRGLQPGASYFFRAYSTENDLPSAVVSTLTPTGVAAPFAGSVSEREMVWNWTDDQTGATGFRVIRVSDGRDLSGPLSGETFSWKQGGLTPNAAVQVFLRAEGPSGIYNSAPSAPAWTRPNPPRSTRLTGLSYGQVSLAWDKNGNPPGTTFDVYYSTGGGEKSIAVHAGDSSMATVVGLSPQTAYVFSVRSAGPAGPSAPDQDVSATTSPNPLAFELANPDWKFETVETEGNVGKYATLVLDRSGQPHIFYRSGGEQGDLKIAQRGLAGWAKNVIVHEAQVGATLSARFDREGHPALMYYNEAEAALNYVTQDGAAWSSETLPLDSLAGHNFMGAVLDLSSVGDPRIVYGAAQRFYETRKVDGGWSNDLIRSFESVPSTAPKVGDIRMALDSKADPHAVYFYGEGGDLFYSHRVGESWISEIIESGITGQDTLVSVQIDEFNRPHVAYIDLVNHRVRYAEKESDAWSLETVDAGKPYAFVNMALDGRGAPHVVFNDFDTGTLRYAHRVASRWEIQTVDSEVKTGWYPSIAVDNDGDIHVAYQNFSDGDLKYARLSHRSTEIRATVQRAGGRYEFNGAQGAVAIDVPTGTSNAAVTLTLRSPDLLPFQTSPRRGLLPLWVGLEILTTPQAKPARPVTIIFSYGGINLLGNSEHRLTFARYDAVSGLWIAVPTKIDTERKQLTITLAEFTPLQLMMLVPSDSVKEARAYPNPFQPNQPGHDQITFDGLPTGTQLKIYTLTGQFVTELTEDGSGKAKWNATNANGAPVASGVYFVRAEGPGGDKILKVAVQR